MKQQIQQLNAVLVAMETLTLSGSKNCGTYYNCMQLLLKTINELKKIEDNNLEQTDIDPE